MKNPKLLKKFEEFTKSIKESEKIALIHHRDTDGLCAAVVFSKALEILRGKMADSVLSAEYFEFKETIGALRKIMPDRIIALDLSIDQDKKNARALEGIAPLLLLDHHKIYNKVGSPRTLFIKSQMISGMDGSKYPASKLVFDLCSRLVDLSKEQWIACVGLLGDMGYRHWKPFFENTIRENRVSLKELGELEELVSAVETIDSSKFNELFSEFHSKNPKELLKSPLNKYKKLLKKELQKWKSDFKKKAEFFPGIGLYFYEFKTSIELKSALIDSLTLEYPDKTIIVVQDLGKRMLRFSGRRQDFKVKVNDLLEQAVKGIQGADAGGHIPAAAGSIPREKLNVFKENVTRILGGNPTNSDFMAVLGNKDIKRAFREAGRG